MAKKMYYTEAEAAAMLGLGPEDLAKLVTDQKLRVFHDGPKQMYKAEEIDALAGGDSTESAEIELAPTTPQAEVEPMAEAPPPAEQPAPAEPPAAVQPVEPPVAMQPVEPPAVVQPVEPP
ncbi:MAG: helix-turn-helix domain-containing protein, partial [Phycisphaerae bacterium]|nr:helix-turn-helix domain-containing protein [Phycisphaerae bacterium]